MTLLPNTAMFALFGPIAGYLADRRGPRLVATCGLVMTAIGLTMLTQLPAAATYWQLAIPLVIAGAGMGTFAPPNRASVMSAVPPQDRGLAAGISTTLINFGNSVSRSLAFVVMGAVVPVAALDEMFVGNYGAVGGAFTGSFVEGIHLVFLVSTVFVLLSIVPSILRGGREVPGKAVEAPPLQEEEV